MAKDYTANGEMMEFEVLNCDLIEAYKCDQPYIVISIFTPGGRTEPLPYDGLLMGVLRLYFSDFDEPVEITNLEGTKEWVKVFDNDMAKKVIDFVGLFPEVKKIVCQCEAGISRSAGVAAGLSKFFNDDDKYFFEKYLPNMLVYRKILDFAKKDTDHA